MAINWKVGLHRGFKKMGTPWTHLKDGEPTTFYGIFNMVDGYQDVQGGQPQLVKVSTLATRTEDANSLEFGQEVRDECDTVWYVARKTRLDDGFVTEIQLVESPL